MPPAQTYFIQVCRTAKIPATASAQRLQFLHDAGIAASDGLSSKLLAERCAALTWARDSFHNDVNPDSWPTLLNPALLASLQGLYVLPPHKGAAPQAAPSSLRRLANIIITYTPNDPAAAAPQPPPQPDQSDGLNVTRPDSVMAKLHPFPAPSHLSPRPPRTAAPSLCPTSASG